MLLQCQVIYLKCRQQVVQLILRVAQVIVVRVVALEHLHDEVWIFLLGRLLSEKAVLRLRLLHHWLRRAHLCEVHVGIVNLHQVVLLLLAGLIKFNCDVWLVST